MSASRASTALTVGDVNNDGLGDLVFTTAAPTSGVVVDVIYGSPDGNVADPATFAPAYTGTLGGVLLLADLNRDGVADLVRCTSDAIWIKAGGSAAAGDRAVQRRYQRRRVLYGERLYVVPNTTGR